MTSRISPRALDPSEGTPGQVPAINAAGDAFELTNPADGAVAAADVSYAGSAGLSATDVEAALDELDTEKVAQGVDQFRTGPRAFPVSTDYVKLQSSEADANGMVIWTQKVGADSTDVNIDGSVIVKHGKSYINTPGYSDTLQLYTLAGSAGTILGNNNFVELGAPPYSIPADPTPNGYIRFELGPAWPDSEVARLNNRGDLIVGWNTRTSGSTYTQAGTTVTRAGGAASFTADDVGAYLLYTEGSAWCDRITGYISATQVTVETARTIISGMTAEVRIPRIVLRHDGTVETDAGFVVKQRPGQAGALLEVRDDSGAVVFSVDETGVTTPDLSGGTTSTTGELLMQDGVTGPPVPLETEGRDDWLYQG